MGIRPSTEAMIEVPLVLSKSPLPMKVRKLQFHSLSPFTSLLLSLYEDDDFLTVDPIRQKLPSSPYETHRLRLLSSCGKRYRALVLLALLY